MPILNYIAQKFENETNKKCKKNYIWNRKITIH